jgi:deoxycytidine triphosphate deaminase
MPILSDHTIRRMVGDRLLVVDGDVSQARFCSYQFTPAKIFTAGKESTIVDWERPSQPHEDRFVLIEPGQLVWIRNKGRIRLPNNVCAFWWQTSTLSRQGLMLVNMSMVEPGYEGPLACLFVNFGKSRIRIGPNTVVAKLVFQLLDRETDSRWASEMDVERYDSDVHSNAVNGPTSFLCVADLWSDLTSQRTTARVELEELARKAKNDLDGATAHARTDLETATKSASETFKESLKTEQNAQMNRFKEDIKGSSYKLLGWAVAGFVIIFLAMTFVPWLQGLMKPGLSGEIQGKVEDAISKRLLIPSAVQASPSIVERVEKLEKQLQARPAGQ